MSKQTTHQQSEEESDVLRGDFLKPEELFLLGYIKQFDRKKAQRWEELELWDFSIGLEDDDE